MNDLQHMKILHLLKAYGMWSRYKGVKGFKTGHTPPTQTITDEKALFVDQCMAKLKYSKFNCYQLLALHYIKLMPIQAIYRYLKKSHCKDFELVPSLQKYIKYLSIDDVHELLEKSEQALANIYYSEKSKT